MRWPIHQSPHDDSGTFVEEFCTMHNMKKLSERWIKEGRAFKIDLNAWLAQIYAGNKPSEDEPEDTRADMAEQVVRYARQLNEEGRADELRTLFPPAHEPFDYDDIGPSEVKQVLLLKDERVVACVRSSEGRKTYVIDGNEVTEAPGVRAIARTAYHDAFAKAYDDRLDIHETWDGPVVRSLAWPKGSGLGSTSPSAASLDDFGVLATLSLFPGGKRAVLASECGVFLVDDDGGQLLHPSIESIAEDMEDDDDDDWCLSLDYPHAAISPDGAIIAVGVQEPPHVLLRELDGKWAPAAEIYPRSSYPHAACFHDAKPHVALAGCHFGGSATVGLDLDKLPSAGSDLLQLSGYDGDPELSYIDDRFWIYSMAPIEEGYVLGANNGYLWAHAFEDRKQLWFCHLGSTLTTMDISEDRKTLVVGTYSGQTILLRLGQPRDEGQLVTDTDIREERRWVFWGGAPMAW